MPRPDRSEQRRAELIPVVAAAFAELGYRRTTTALLADRCGLQEQALYRLWPDKRAMFVAAIGFVGAHSEQVWQRVLAGKGPGTGAERVVAHQARHLGEAGFYRILFAGFSETDDPEIAAALRRMYEHLLGILAAQVTAHRRARRAGTTPPPAPTWTAWALVGLATATNLGRELGLLGDRARRQLFAAVGRHLLG